MKKYSYILYTAALALLCSSLFTLSSCGGDDPSASEKKRKLLEGTWTVSSVTVDGVDHTDLFSGFTLTFNGSTYTATNGDPVWTATGSSFTFTDGSATAFRRHGEDDAIVTISSVTATQLVLTMTWDKDTFGAGRSKSVSGEHVFTFTK